MKKQSNKPSAPKKIYVILVVLILMAGMFIGAVLVLKSQNIKAEDIIKNTSNLLQTTFQITSSDPNQDTDNDGMSDQDEKNYGTDYKNPDTDGDGYLDGEELASGYDPLRPAPGDELDPNAPKTPRPLPNNLTQALSKSLSQKLNEGGLSPMEVNNSTSFMDAGQLDAAINEGLGTSISAASRQFMLQEIDSSEIKTSEDNSLQAAQKYSSQVMAVINKNNPYEECKCKTEFQAISDAVEKSDNFALQKYAQGYATAAQELKQIIAPSKWVNVHKTQISIFIARAEIFKAVMEIKTDPLKANIALQQYTPTLETNLQMLNEGQALVNEVVPDNPNQTKQQ